jgi:hypothetical protein
MSEFLSVPGLRSDWRQHHQRAGIAAVPIADITSPSATFVAELLARAERTEGTELLAFGTTESDRLGELLVSHGQVCLVSLATGQPTLGARLSRRHPETAVLVRNAVAAARTEGRPISGVLADLGGADSERIREALLEQIAEGLCELGRAAPEGLFESRLSASSRHLASVLAGFSARAVYFRTMPLLFSPTTDAASRCFEKLAPRAGKAALCARVDGCVLPVRATGIELPSVASILRFGRDIEQMARPPVLLAAEVEPSLMMIGSDEDSVLVVTTQSQIAVLGDFESRSQVLALGQAARIVAGGA